MFAISQDRAVTIKFGPRVWILLTNAAHENLCIWSKCHKNSFVTAIVSNFADSPFTGVLVIMSLLGLVAVNNNKDNGPFS